MIGRTSGASRFNIDKFSEVLRLRSMEKVVGKRDDFVMDAPSSSPIYQPVSSAPLVTRVSTREYTNTIGFKGLYKAFIYFTIYFQFYFESVQRF